MTEASKDPVDCLKEIAALAMDRMTGSEIREISPDEALTLGMITGTACRVTEVVTWLREREKQGGSA